MLVASQPIDERVFVPGAFENFAGSVATPGAGILARRRKGASTWALAFSHISPVSTPGLSRQGVFESRRGLDHRPSDRLLASGEKSRPLDSPTRPRQPSAIHCRLRRRSITAESDVVDGAHCHITSTLPIAAGL